MSWSWVCCVSTALVLFSLLHFLFLPLLLSSGTPGQETGGHTWVSCGHLSIIYYKRPGVATCQRQMIPCGVVLLALTPLYLSYDSCTAHLLLILLYQCFLERDSYLALQLSSFLFLAPGVYSTFCLPFTILVFGLSAEFLRNWLLQTQTHGSFFSHSGLGLRWTVH